MPVLLVNESLFISQAVNFSMYYPEVYKLDRRLRNKIELCGIIVNCWESIGRESSCWPISIRSGAKTQQELCQQSAALQAQHKQQRVH